MECVEREEEVLPDLAEGIEVGLPLDNLLRGDELLELDEYVVLDGDRSGDPLDRGLELRNVSDELAAKFTGVGADFADLPGEGVKLSLKGVDLGLELPILSGNSLLLSSDLGGQGLLSESDLADGRVESGDGASDLALGGLESFEVGESGGDLD